MVEEDDDGDEFTELFALWDKQDAAGSIVEDQIKFEDLMNGRSFYLVGDPTKKRYFKQLVNLVVTGSLLQGNAISVSEQEPAYFEPEQLVIQLF